MVRSLDKGAYGGGVPINQPVFINQPVTISCGDGLWETSGGFVSVNMPAGSDVVIEGLVADGVGLSGTQPSLMGIFGQGALHLRRARIGKPAWNAR
jgi:hypothetical protein